MAGGLALQAIALGWLALIADAGMSYGELLPPLVLGGIGVSMAIPAGQTAAVVEMNEGELGKASAANSTMRELGGVFGIALVVAVFSGAGGYGSPAAFADGFAPAVAAAGGLALLGSLVALALPSRAEVVAAEPA